jgi:hypothetical protein
LRLARGLVGSLVGSLAGSLEEDGEVSTTLELELEAMNILELEGVDIVLAARLVMYN